MELEGGTIAMGCAGNSNHVTVCGIAKRCFVNDNQASTSLLSTRGRDFGVTF